jgi:NAD(P)-dependent dehydrogenase (short-subunit alcohol dehydrogenase family)
MLARGGGPVAGSFGGKVALVTGAGKGIGEAISRAFVREGAAVGCMDIDAAAVSDVAVALGGGRAVAISGDVRSSGDCERAVRQTVEVFGRLDILVNNAGVVRYALAEQMTEEDWDFVVDTNLKGPWLMAKYAIPHLLARGGGAIVNVSSVQAVASQAGVVSYTASKGGLVAMTRTLALDHAAEGLRANCIIPGSTRTPMLIDAARKLRPHDPAGALREWGEQYPIGRLIEPGDVANLVLFLASDQASAITASTYFIEGGLLARLGVS